MKKSFTDRLADVESTRPVFTGVRGDPEAGIAHDSVLARMDDDGALEVLQLIDEDEMSAFIVWCKKTWR